MVKLKKDNSITIPSDISCIKEVISKVIDSVKDRNLDSGAMFDIRLSAEEAIRNAIQHGNKNKKELPVNIKFNVDEKSLELIIEDKGEGYDYRHIPDPTTDKNILKTCGRGVYLIHKLMDEVHYNDKGNTIRMIKYLK